VKLTKVDDLIRPQHHYLEADDKCFFLREYTAGKGYSYGQTNSIISNLKKEMDRRGRSEWIWKERAIEQAGNELRAAIGAKALQEVTIVPMPPSKAKDDPMYDDRVLQIVQVMTRELTCDVRELVLQRMSVPAAHTTTNRARPEDHYENYCIDETVAAPEPARILVVDDVLTAGAHFAGIKRRLRERFPAVAVYGCFYARRALPTAADEFSEISE
jgi:predicted amidophosphoribosyltransferase